MHSTSRRLQLCNGVAGSLVGASDWSDVTMLGQLTGTMYLSGMMQSVVLTTLRQ